MGGRRINAPGGTGLLGKAAWITGMAIIASSFSLIFSGAYGLLLYAMGSPAERYSAMVMFGAGIMYLLAGLLMYSKGEKGLIRLGEAIIITVAVWFLIPLLDSLPFMSSIHIPFIDALFESVSGWTTTGLTILTGQPSSWHHVFVPSASTVPSTIKVWRTLMQWEGGLGIVVLTIAILAPPGVSVANLYLAEGKFERLAASFKKTAYIMGLIYLILTGIGTILFVLAGMPVGDAIQHSMTGIATAGFSTHDESLGYYMGKPWILVAGMIVMFLGSMNFADHYALLKGRLDRLKESVELQAQLAIITIAALLAYLSWIYDPGFHATYGRLQVIFHIVSAFATGGFQAGSIHASSEAYKMILAILCLIGGSAFSTAGGIKVFRLLIAMKTIKIQTESIVKPRGYRPSRKLGKYYIDDQAVQRVLATMTAFISVYILLVIILSIAVPYYDIGDDFFEVASAMGNVGLSTGISAAASPIVAKAVLIAGMLLGRLEVITYLVALRFLLYGKI